MSLKPSFLVIGNPENRRILMFQEALRRNNLPDAAVLSYQDLLSGKRTIDTCLQGPVIVRVESPGESFEVEKQLLALGAFSAAQDGTAHLTESQVGRLEYDRGLIIHPRQWFLGFRHVLSQIKRDVGAHRCYTMNHPDDIAIMFDKVACQEILANAQIPIPARLGTISCFDDLLDRMRDARCQRAFVKLAHGSSASGVIAFRTDGKTPRATTTVELVRTGSNVRLYNSRRLRHYRDHRDIAEIINCLCKDRVYAEQWLPKAKIDGEQFDLRVVVIAGKPQHCVVRQSRGPLTNLHLGNRRGDVAKFRSRIGDYWHEVRQTCERVMANFPRSLYAGIDVVISPDFREHAVLEVNAFGDLLPGIEHDGMDTYTAEVKALTNHLSKCPLEDWEGEDLEGSYSYSWGDVFMG